MEISPGKYAAAVAVGEHEVEALVANGNDGVEPNRGVDRRMRSAIPKRLFATSAAASGAKQSV